MKTYFENALHPEVLVHLEVADGHLQCLGRKILDNALYFKLCISLLLHHSSCIPCINGPVHEAQTCQSMHVYEGSDQNRNI